MGHVLQCQKMQTMWVTSSPKPISFDYSIHNIGLENVFHIKYLGITIQSNLKWDVHCKQVAAKATNTLNVLKQNLKYTKEVHKIAYKFICVPPSQICSICGLSSKPITAMFPLLDYATPATIQTQGNNFKFFLPHCSTG